MSLCTGDHPQGCWLGSVRLVDMRKGGSAALTVRETPIAEKPQKRCSDRKLVCCTAGSPGRRAGWNLLRACESREQGRDGRDTPGGRRPGDDGVPRWSCVAPRLLRSMRCTSEVMWPGRAFHGAYVARAPTPFQCAHVATWKVAPTAPTASPGPCPPSVPCCSWQDKARQRTKSAMSARPLQRSVRAWNPRSWQHLRKV